MREAAERVGSEIRTAMNGMPDLGTVIEIAERK